MPWKSWHSFEDKYITNNDCKESIKEMISHSNLYNKRYNKAVTAIREAKCMTGNHLQICSNARNRK